MGTFSIWHWLVVLAVLILVFGTKKLRSLGGDLGAAVRGFKQGMKEEDGKRAALEEPQVTVAASETSTERPSKTS